MLSYAFSKYKYRKKNQFSHDLSRVGTWIEMQALMINVFVFQCVHFLEKNKDTLRSDVVELMCESKNKVILDCQSLKILKFIIIIYTFAV